MKFLNSIDQESLHSYKSYKCWFGILALSPFSSSPPPPTFSASPVGIQAWSVMPSKHLQISNSLLLVVGLKCADSSNTSGKTSSCLEKVTARNEEIWEGFHFLSCSYLLLQFSDNKKVEEHQHNPGIFSLDRLYQSIDLCNSWVGKQSQPLVSKSDLATGLNP